MTEANALNAATTGIVGNTGTAFTATAVTQYNVLVGGSTSSTLTNVAPSATSGVPIISQGASSNPVFGTVVVSGGGTGNISATAFTLQAGGTTTTAAFQSITNGAASSTVLIGNGTSTLPSFSATPQLTALGIGATAGASGLTFDGSNLLQNYATGTFTTTRVGASTAGTTTYTGQGGNYIRIGSLVWVKFGVAGTGATGTGNILYGGLPFNVSTTIAPTATVLFINAQTWPALTTTVTALMIANSATFQVLGFASAVANAFVQIANTTFNEQINITYSV